MADHAHADQQERSQRESLANSSSFMKTMLDDDWYMAATPDNSLMEEMKELSYPSLPSQPESSTTPSILSNLEPSQLQTFLARTPSSFKNPDKIIPNFSSLLDGSASFDNSSESLGTVGLVVNGGLLAASFGSGNTGQSGGHGSRSVNTSTMGSFVHSNVLGDLVASSHHNPLLMTSCQGGLLGGSMHSASPRSPVASLTGLNSFNQPNLASHNHIANLSNLSPRALSLGGLGSDAYNSFSGNLSNLMGGFNGSSSLGNHGLGNGLGGSSFGNNFGSALLTGVNDANSSVSRNLNLLGKDCSLNERTPSRSKLLRPLEISPSLGSQPTLFHKRAAQRHMSAPLPPPPISPTVKSPTRVLSSGAGQSSPLGLPDEGSPSTKTKSNDQTGTKDWKQVQNSSCEEVGERGELALDEQDLKDDDDIDESGDGSGVLYETDDAALDGAPQGLTSSDAPADKGKGKKGLPAKNLMAERRRRKKLNDRLYTLRSVVPKITKMDRASILGDAIEYLKELLQRINDLHNELESSAPERPMLQGPPSFQSLTPASSNLPCRVKEECPSSLTSPDTQPPKVEVRTREGRALNIHMFCARRPGLLLSTMRALDGLGLDVQQAVISCFNGFALDVFRAEQSQDGEVAPEEIKRVLLLTASSHSSVV